MGLSLGSREQNGRPARCHGRNVGRGGRGRRERSLRREPSGTAAPVGRLRAANRSRTLLAIRFLAAETARATHPAAAVVARAYRVLAEAQEQHRAAVWHVVDEPETELWALGAARELVHGGDR